MQSPKKLMMLVLVLGLVLSACNLPSARKNATPTDSVMTVAAKTVQVLMTANAGKGTPNPPATNTLMPTATRAPSLTPAPPTSIPIVIPCDRAEFVDDVTVPDGSTFNPGQGFVKTWRLRNNGTCTWTTAYALIFDSGAGMGGSVAIGLPGSVPPGQYIDVSVNLTAPTASGKYKGYWRLRNASGATFGIGANANVSFWVDIQVANITPTVTLTPTGIAPLVIYDFANNYCAATWISGFGTLPCPGTDTDSHGFVVRMDNPTLQDGVGLTGRALETHPQWVDNGVITGRFPPLDVLSGYHFKTRIGCRSGGANCNVTFQFNYRVSGGSLQNLGSWPMKYTDAPKDLDIDLSSLAGQSVEFVLAVTANGSSGQAWATWFKPIVVK
jgi:hypothetical protein